MIDTDKKGAACTTDRNDAMQYRCVYVTFFSIFLILTLIGRVIPQQWRVVQGEQVARKSIIQESREQAGTFVPFVFMNH